MYSKYILISLLLILVSLFLINFKKIEKFRNENKRTFDFVLSLISTFTGFFIALSLNTILGIIQQKANLVKLLNASNLAIENCKMRTQGTYINGVKSGVNISELLKTTPAELPRIYPNLEEKDLVNSYFSANGFQAYILCMDGMENFVNNLNTAALSDDRKIKVVNAYMNYLTLATKINTLERDRINGDISQSDEDKQLQTIATQLTSK
ncbi:MAG: hypothetical protein QM610_09150 [Chitinophagaceae bacterium]